MNNVVENWTEWLKSSRFSYMSDIQQQQTINWLMNVRNNILNIANIQQGETVIDVGSGNGLLAFGALLILDESGKVIISDKFEDCLTECQKIAESSGVPNNLIDFLQSDAADIKLPDNSVDVAVMRSVLVHILDKQKPLNEIARILKPNGRLSFYEPVISSNTRYHELVNIIDLDIADKIIKAEDHVMNSPNDPLTNFTVSSLQDNLSNAGFSSISVEPVVEKSTYPVQPGMIDQWFNTPPSPGGKTMKDRLLETLSEEEFNRYKAFLEENTLGKEITINTTSIYCLAVK